MPTFRPDITAITPYVAGRSIEEVALEIGADPDDIIKLASNESPDGPFPGVIEAGIEALKESHRYPDDAARSLTAGVSDYVDVPPDHLWFGNGSVALLGSIALTAGGPGTSAVYGWPSFVMYRIISRWSMAEPIEVPLDDTFTFDLDAIGAAMRDDTTLVYLCNPNNPTGTVVAGDAIEAFVESVPESVVVVIDEAYCEFVADRTYCTGIPLALARPNVVVLRTFSKVFGLAAHRLGYAIARPETLTELRKAQAPFSVARVSQAAGVASLSQPVELDRRVRANASGRSYLLSVVVERGITHSHSEANFVFMKLGDDSASVARLFEKKGVIIRPMSGGWQRVSVGTEVENQRFVAVLDELEPGVRRSSG